jgi:hypothetical protein
MSCQHENFDAYVAVNRINKDGEDPGIIVAYLADVKVSCRDCGQPFEFFGIPLGMSFYQPTMSINGQEAHIPLVLPGTEPPAGLAGFRVTCQSFSGAEPTKQ